MKHLFLTVAGRLLNITLIPLNAILSKRGTMVIARGKSGIGDHILMTNVVRFLRSQGWRCVVFSEYPELFLHLSGCRCIANQSLWPPVRILLYCVMYLAKQSQMVHFRFYERSGEKLEDFMRRTQLRCHLRDVCLLQSPITETIASYPPNPEIQFSGEETTQFDKQFAYLPAEFALIISESKTTYSPLKNWGADKMAEVVNSCKERIPWIQIGMTEDPALDDCRFDLRGKTGLRELLYLMSKAAIVVCNEGLLTHASAAFNTPCITIFSGFHPPEISAYDNITAVVSKEPFDCAYCWTLGPCPLFPTAKCIRSIEAADVVNAVLRCLDDASTKQVQTEPSQKSNV